MIRAFIALTFIVAATLHAQLPGSPTIDFKKHVQPIFAKHCYDCHSVGKKKEKAGFVFDDVKRLANDVGPGRIIVPKDLEQSDLIPIVMGANGKKMMAATKRPKVKTPMNWTNKEGKAIKATFEGMEGEFVLLRTENGQLYKYPLSNLNMAGQFQAKMQAEQ